MTTRLLLLAALVALIAVMVQWRLLDREPAQTPEEVLRPGYFLTGVVLEEFDTDGQLRIGLESKSANEDPSSGVVRLADVAVDYHTPNGRRWHLTSVEARVPPAGRIIEFEGNVHLNGTPGDGTQQAELHTARLQLDTDAETAQTRSAVEISLGSHVMHATGMRADLKKGSLRLESGVNGTFTP